ncbi:Ldh family oxidoreductase [Verrucomicrobia bacterium]|nr:Ldh family oxidoreductase [Verrucomicrobiota bacterium]MDC0324079.1 Ldh family oxidoreductase [Verrucomicrobiota bacterium]
MKQLFVIDSKWHDKVVQTAFENIGYTQQETLQVVRNCRGALENGVRTHNAIKALHLESLFGSKVGGTVCGANIIKKKGRFSSVRVWDAQKKIGPPVAYEAIEECAALADCHGIGAVAVDNAWHYFWGGGYVLELANRGFIGFTLCSAMLSEVVPFGGSKSTLGTNPHSWGIPTQEVCGFPVLIDWATSTISMGKVQQFAREGQKLPPNSAVDSEGNITRDPTKVNGLLPFGAHKGYGLSLLNELFAGLIGGWKPTERGRFSDGVKKATSSFYFMAIHPDAIAGEYVTGDRTKNLATIISDILGDGNSDAILPGQKEYEARCQNKKSGGLLVTHAEFDAFNDVAKSNGISPHKEIQLEKKNENEEI